jgi:hypothetical protein
MIEKIFRNEEAPAAVFAGLAGASCISFFSNDLVAIKPAF